MAYEKQNFVDGMLLNAEHMIKIEDGILAIEDHQEVVDEDITELEKTVEQILNKKDCNIIYLESNDSDLKVLRDLSSGIYVLYGKFKLNSASNDTITFTSDLLATVAAKTAGTHIQILNAVNNSVQFLSISDDSCERGTIYLNDLALNSSIGILSDLKTDDITNLVAAINEVKDKSESDLDTIESNFNKFKSDIKAQTKKAAPRNLLDNSDFRNPVNQRGKTSYSGTAYGIDRWKSWSSSEVVTVNDGFISNTARIIQLLPYDTNKVYTVAGCKLDENGNMKINVGSGNPTDSGFGDYNNGAWCSINKGTLYVGAAKGNWLWVALYEGKYTEDTLPEYQPKGYEVELQACKRYYQRINPGYIPFGFGWSNNTTAAETRVTVPCSPMIVNGNKPTVTFSGTLNNVRFQFQQGAVNVASVNGVHYDEDAEFLAIFMTPKTVYVGPFVAYCISDSEVFELSSDL